MACGLLAVACGRGQTKAMVGLGSYDQNPGWAEHPLEVDTSVAGSCPVPKAAEAAEVPLEKVAVILSVIRFWERNSTKAANTPHSAGVLGNVVAAGPIVEVAGAHLAGAMALRATKVAEGLLEQVVNYMG